MSHRSRLLAAAALMAAAGIAGTKLPHPEPLAPCVREDGPGPCVWYADLRGNGEGRSFVLDADDTVTYLDGSTP